MVTIVTWLTVMEYLCHKWPRICSNCRKHFPVLSSFTTYYPYKTKDRVTRTPLKTGCELRCSGGASSSCSTSGTRRVNLVSNPVISREWGKNREVFTTIGTYPWSFVTQIFHNGQPSHDGDHNRCLMSAISLREQDTLWRKYDDILDQKTKS
jgi:hypothetical protein